MTQFTVLYDANVLYPSLLRDVMLRLATTGLFRAKWSKQIQDEWTCNLQKNHPDLADKIPGLVEKINKNFHDCMVSGFEHLIPCVSELPDPGDGHVLAAAIQCRAEIIVTKNIKDFPSEVLDKYGIEVRHPDDFITELCDLSLSKCLEAFRKTRAPFKNPPLSQDQFLGRLLKNQLPQTVKLLDEYKLAF